MKDFCFANYYKIMKENSLNTSIKDPEFMGDMFSIINVEHYFIAELQKGSVSRIINRSLGVPSTIKEMLPSNNSKERIYKSLNEFIDKYYSENVHDILWIKLKGLIAKNKYLSSEEINRILNESNFITFMTNVYIEAIRVPNKIVDVKQNIVCNGKTELNYDFNDIFEIAKKKKKIIVIPVDANFDTKVETPLECLFPRVDENSLHGKWINMMKSYGVSIKELENKIIKGMTGQNGIGNVSVVPHDNNIYYLVSLSEFDNHNIARASAEDLNHALDSILDIYISNGQSYELIIPLLGTGKSKIGFNHEKSFYTICNYFKTKIEKVSGKIRIVIYQDDMDRIDI